MNKEMLKEFEEIANKHGKLMRVRTNSKVLPKRIGKGVETDIHLVVRL